MSRELDSKLQKTKPNKQESEFKVYINKGELERIHEWVKAKSNIETGGDLFGLWIDANTAVVQFVLGPGKGCRRTKTSFFQDISYLENAGNCFTQKHGLCNIGQWHSHHTIPLFEPSAGDHNTVWSNMPKLDLERFIVFIANIKDSDVTVNCFLYEIKNGQQLPVKKGEKVDIPGESPLRLNDAVMEIVRIGAETLTEVLVSPPIKGNSSQKKTEKTGMVKSDEKISAENGMGGSAGIHNKDTTVSTTTSTSQNNKIASNSGKEKLDNIGHQNINNNKGKKQGKTSTTPEKRRTATLLGFTSNSSKTKVHAPSNTEHPNNPQQHDTVKRQSNKSSATIYKVSAPLEPEYDKTVLHRSNNTSSNNDSGNNASPKNDTTTTTKDEKENLVNKNKNSSNAKQHIKETPFFPPSMIF